MTARRLWRPRHVCRPLAHRLARYRLSLCTRSPTCISFDPSENKQLCGKGDDAEPEPLVTGRASHRLPSATGQIHERAPCTSEAGAADTDRDLARLGTSTDRAWEAPTSAATCEPHGCAGSCAYRSVCGWNVLLGKRREWRWSRVRPPTGFSGGLGGALAWPLSCCATTL